ncbi:MAG: AAA family ATPase [Planctomycetota bacterium]|nr:MAG: AAA family ATPase [Planctomycetota bacterium]
MIAPRRPPSSRPFLAAPRVDFYHPARAIDAALHGTERGIRRAEGIGLVVGPPGTGKSLLLAKLAEHVRDDFDVALLSGARICTRRALWQAILAEIGEPYRGIEEGELRISVVERVRGLAATGSGLVVLVDEANTLPTRLLEELRLLTNIPTPLPAVHVVLAGTLAMEERLGMPRMESLTQRIGGRFYLEALDHADSVAYLRTQMKMAGLQWDAVFEPGSDDAVHSITDGVPRFINQLCDLTLVKAAEAGKKRVGPADIASAWRDIQRFPEPTSQRHGAEEQADAPAPFGARSAEEDDFTTVSSATDGFDSDIESSAPDGIIEYGAFDGPEAPADDTEVFETMTAGLSRGDTAAATTAGNPWSGPEVELVFDATDDPFAEYFADEQRAVERYVVNGPVDFSGCRHVASREGAALARQLIVERSAPLSVPVVPACPPPAPAAAQTNEDDSDMVVIEEDLWTPPERSDRKALPVRLGDYRRLFIRLRRGGAWE